MPLVALPCFLVSVRNSSASVFFIPELITCHVWRLASTFQVASTQFRVYSEGDHLLLFREDGTQWIQAQDVPGYDPNTTFFIRDLEPGFQERLQLHKVDGPSTGGV
eukprot:TRINITY_DN6451_c0_g1_i4.p1 TRINITY_DN6451_c0_g1~~TRINITY_DN6451_c0_g1_i4.p1  ORF type:complete len:106 (-),score=11.02 TRINITY_DN6451_c0_g1_i4:129-446(-)